MFESVLSQTAKDTLAVLGKSNLVKGAYLAGGSALALHFGHRYSVDFDFFSQELFDPHTLSQSLGNIGTFKEDLAKGISLIGELNGVKLSCFNYNYPLISPTTIYFDVSIAHPHDIAAMKLVAITDRGTKRDFIDLYELIRQGINMDEMFAFYEKKYHSFEQNKFSLTKALQYFTDADSGEMPQMIKSVSWDEVKRFFTDESMRLAKKYLEG
ncbi:MAG: nucleotidyl transferase AbiEii/AbiGii toxin family protein [Patescibacteria group bacterium]